LKKNKVGQDSITEYKGQPMCYECKEKCLSKEGKTKERIGFFKKYWYVWFGAFITIMIAIFSKNS